MGSGSVKCHTASSAFPSAQHGWHCFPRLQRMLSMATSGRRYVIHHLWYNIQRTNCSNASQVM